MSLTLPRALHDDRQGVWFNMSHDDAFVRVLVSRHALEDVDSMKHCDGRLERFNEYRRQFEQIAREKYDRGFLEQDGTVCIRGRDLPGSGY